MRKYKEGTKELTSEYINAEFKKTVNKRVKETGESLDEAERNLIIEAERDVAKNMRKWARESLKDFQNIVAKGKTANDLVKRVNKEFARIKKVGYDTGGFARIIVDDYGNPTKNVEIIMEDEWFGYECAYQFGSWDLYPENARFQPEPYNGWILQMYDQTHKNNGWN